MRVSIVIDNYNYEAYVAQTIDSALAQSHGDVEIIVVDDGSPDRSMDVIKRYAGRVAAIIDKPNGGQATAYNAGFARCTGDLVMFLDADDWLYPDAVRDIVAAWRPGVSKVQFRLDMCDAQGAPLGRRLPRDMHDHEAPALMREFGTYGSPPGSGNVYHRSFLERVLPMDPVPWRIGADTIPILLAPAYGAIASVTHSLGGYRVHKPASDKSLLFNNSPTGLLSEFERLMAAKRVVTEGLQQVGIAHAQPLGLAPWEARTVALCIRFGGEAVRRALPDTPAALIRQALGGLWRWPAMPWPRKLALMAWVLGVTLLPEALALRIARLHRQSAGAPVAA